MSWHLSRATIERVYNLNDRDWTPKEIATELKMSVVTVGRILGGQITGGVKNGKPTARRCPGCGGMITTRDCMFCKLARSAALHGQTAYGAGTPSNYMGASR